MTSSIDLRKVYNPHTDKCKNCKSMVMKVLYPKSGVGSPILVCLSCGSYQYEVQPQIDNPHALLEQ